MRCWTAKIRPKARWRNFTTWRGPIWTRIRETNLKAGSAYWSTALPYKYQSDLDHLFDGLRKAGLLVGEGPEGRVQAAGPTRLASSEKPSIAVLPLTNMSDEPEQVYFSDGITEDIITELSRFRSLQVVARNSTFVYRDQTVDVKDAGRALGAKYLLEGSLRKAGRRIRLTAQLIDVETGKHIWAERYDPELTDIFAVQDELVHAIVMKTGRPAGGGGNRALAAQAGGEPHRTRLLPSGPTGLPPIQQGEHPGSRRNA